MTDTWVVLPTYNEVGNLESLLEKIFGLIDCKALVVDDHSPDGTGELAERLRRRWPGLAVLHRPGKAGLGSAYRDGFQLALTNGARRVIQMDADGSHDPALLPVLLAALDRADLVLGSRYVAGGSFTIAWHRRWISLLGNFYIRMLLGRSIHDWSTGYKAWRADFLHQVLAEPSTAVGYAWLMEMTWLARQLGGRIVEVPLRFRERGSGQSKFTWRIAAEDLRLAWRLRRQHRPAGLVREEKT